MINDGPGVSIIYFRNNGIIVIGVILVLQL